MAFAFDYDGTTVRRWSRTENGVECERDEFYTPSFYVSTESDAIEDLRSHLSMWPDVEKTAVEEWRRGFRHDSERVLCVDVDGIEAVSEVASEVRGWVRPASIGSTMSISRESSGIALRRTPTQHRRQNSRQWRSQLSWHSSRTVMSTRSQSMTSSSPETRCSISSGTQVLQTVCIRKSGLIYGSRTTTLSINHMKN